jgi:lambda family phage portal protein
MMDFIRSLLNFFGKKKPDPEPPKRSYSGALYNRLTNDWTVSSASADSENWIALRTLRNRSRDLVRNNDYAKNAVRTIASNVVGEGIVLQSQVKDKKGKLDEKINAAIEFAWQEWLSAKNCHTAGTLDFPEIESLLIKSLVESGEVFVRIIRQSFGSSKIPLALELVEADQIADEYNAGANSANLIRMGIEMNDWQRPIAYWLYPHHPGDYQFSFSQIGSRLLRVGADEIIHLFVCDRVGQSRGIPWFHSAIMRLRNLGGYEEAEIVAARAQANVMGFIQTPDGDFFATDDNGQKISNLSPGAIEVLAPGETFAGFAPSRPNAGFDPFVTMMLRGVAAGIGTSYESLSRDYSKTSYSSARTALLDERKCFKIIQKWMIRKFHKVVFKQWLEMAVLSNQLKLPGYEVSPKLYLQDKWTAPGWPWVDPSSEIDAHKEAIKGGFSTISQVVAQSGLDIEDVLKERRRELDLAKELGITFDTTVIEPSIDGDRISSEDSIEQDNRTNSDLSALNARELRALAKEVGLPGYSIVLREQKIEGLRAALVEHLKDCDEIKN